MRQILALRRGLWEVEFKTKVTLGNAELWSDIIGCGIDNIDRQNILYKPNNDLKLIMHIQ